LAVPGITQELRERLEAVGLPVTSDLLNSDKVFDKIKNDKRIVMVI